MNRDAIWTKILIISIFTVLVMLIHSLALILMYRLSIGFQNTESGSFVSLALFLVKMCSYLQIVLIINCCRLLVGAGTNILRENFPQKNLSGFLSPPDAITFLCGEFSKHIWTQRQENTIGRYKQIQIKTGKYRNSLASSISPHDAITFFWRKFSKDISTLIRSSLTNRGN